ncbi:hypothetical protein SAMN04490208_0001 [Pseudomonas poae]|uniref:Uncharacterized protein n=1 Tax=Pseudomonas poae TaxID=200451 RepID=A0ABY0R9W6_9PSED|nr:hypothetical protein SAMN04490208_0001 [Pseudomonas poae]
MFIRKHLSQFAIERVRVLARFGRSMNAASLSRQTLSMGDEARGAVQVPRGRGRDSHRGSGLGSGFILGIH